MRLAAANKNRRRTRAQSLLCLPVFALAAWAAPAAPNPGAAGDTAAVPRSAAAPTLDGDLSDPVWRQAAVIRRFTQAEPNEGTEPSEATEVLLLYDTDTLYIGVRCHDTQPKEIIAKELQRDGLLDGDDSIAITLDTFRNQRHGYYFQTNPLGTRRDGLIAQERDSSTFEPVYQADWDGIWLAQSRIDADGWTAEIAIPFKSLSFDPEHSTWGFNIERTIARKREIVRWTGARRQVRVFNMGEAGSISGLNGINQGIGLDVIPYIKARMKQTNGETDLELKPGLDAFYKLTPSVTLGLTLNTDFAEAEVDERQVNLTRFPLFFPEKRTFFLQDANYFKFGGIQQSPLPFFSRKIGLSNNGQPIGLQAGIKATGRSGPLTFGLFDVQTDALGDLPAKNLAVGRATLDIGKESSVGAIFTHGDPLRVGDNTLGGFDLNYKHSDVFGTGQVVEANAYAMMTDTDGINGQAFGGRLLYPNFAWDGGLIYDQISQHFNPAMGFISQAGTRELTAWLGKRWRLDFADHIYVQLWGRKRTDLQDRLIDQEIWLPFLHFETQSRDQIEFGNVLWREQYYEAFELLPRLLIPVGEYDYLRHMLWLQSSDKRELSGTVEVTFGEYLDGQKTDLYGKLTWRASSRFNLSGGYTQNAITLPQGNFTVHLAQLSVKYAFTPNLSWNVIGQYDNVTGEFGLNSRLRWTIQPGSDVFLVFNQAADTSLSRFRWTTSDLSAKVAWTFRF